MSLTRLIADRGAWVAVAKATRQWLHGSLRNKVLLPLLVFALAIGVVGSLLIFRYFSNALAGDAWLFIALFLTSLAGGLGLVYVLLNHFVLIPSEEIGRVMQRRAAGDDGAYAPVTSNDEIGQLAGQLNSMLDAVTERDVRQQRVLEGSGAVYWDWELSTGRVDFGITGWTRILGYQSEDLEPNIRVWDELLHPEDRPGAWQAIRAHLEGRAPDFQADYRLRSKSGEWLWFHAHAKIAMRDLQGKPLHIAGTLVDINARKSAEERLKQSELWFRLLIENVSDVIGVIGLDGAIRYISPAAKQVGGYEPEELLGKRFLDFVHPDDRSAILGKLDELIQSSETRHVTECRYRHKDGSWRSLETSATNLANRPEVGGIVVIIRDVTDRKLAEKAQAQLAAIVESSRDGIMGVDPNGVVTSWNFGAEKIFGYRAAEVAGRHVSMLAPPGRGHESKEIIGKILRGADAFRLETVRMRKDGERFDAAYVFSPILDAHANIVGVSASIQDITDRKRAEQKLKLFEALVNQSSDGIEVNDPETLRILDVNDKTCEDLGYSREELLTMTVFDIDPVFDRAAQRRAEAHFLRSDRLVLQTMHKRKNGSTFPVEVSIKRVKLDRSYNVVVARDITERIAIETERQAHSTAIHRGLEQTIQAVAMALEMRDVYTAGHQRRVADLAVAIAQELGLPEDRIHGLDLAASIHDVGKIYVPAEILSKPTRLTEVEYSLVKTHAQAGYEILKGVDFPWPIAEMVYQHHEQMDGSGYPRGLKDEQILLEARIIAVADTVEAMSSHRPYRAGIGLEAALDEIVKKRGSSYDAAVVDACIRLFREKGYHLPVQKAA